MKEFIQQCRVRVFLLVSLMCAPLIRTCASPECVEGSVGRLFLREKKKNTRWLKVWYSISLMRCRMKLPCFRRKTEREIERAKPPFCGAAFEHFSCSIKISSFIFFFFLFFLPGSLLISNVLLFHMSGASRESPWFVISSFNLLPVWRYLWNARCVTTGPQQIEVTD